MGLFRTIHVHQNNSTVAPAYPQTIHEHKAPTDKSIGLLMEMEEAAVDKILATYRFQNTLVEGVLVVFQRNPGDFDKVAYIRFSVNGKRMSFKRPIDNREESFDKPRAIEMFAAAVRDAIYDCILPEIAKEYEGSP